MPKMQVWQLQSRKPRFTLFGDQSALPAFHLSHSEYHYTSALHALSPLYVHARDSQPGPEMAPLRRQIDSGPKDQPTTRSSSHHLNRKNGSIPWLHPLAT